MNPLDLRGPEFLRFYLVLIPIAIGMACLLRWLLRTPSDWWGNLPSLDAYDVAYLAGGQDAAVDSAVASLVHRGVLVADRFTRRIKAATQLHEGAHMVEAAVYRLFDAHSATIETIRSAIQLSRIQGRLKDLELLMSPGRSMGIRLISSAPMVALVLLGYAKINIGITRGRPVGYLVMLTLGVALIAFAFARFPLHRSRRGDKVLAHFKDHNAALGTTGRRASHLLAPLDVALATGLFGVAAVASGALADLATAMKPPPKARSSSGSSGCGGSSCGGSGCGGGCGGGGCGGCGS